MPIGGGTGERSDGERRGAGEEATETDLGGDDFIAEGDDWSWGGGEDSNDGGDDGGGMFSDSEDGGGDEEGGFFGGLSDLFSSD